MIKYTFKDVKALATEIAHFFKDPNINYWYEIADTIREQFPEIKETVLELLGDSVFSFPREACKKIGLTDLIFETPVKEMPFYIESENAWELIVARWRLAIQK